MDEDAQAPEPEDADVVDEVQLAGCRLAAQHPEHAPVPRPTLCRHSLKVGAQCGSSARWDLCGGGERSSSLPRSFGQSRGWWAATCSVGCCDNVSAGSGQGAPGRSRPKSLGGLDRTSRLNPAGALRAALTSFAWVAKWDTATQAMPVSLDSPTHHRPRPMVPTPGRGICYRQLRIGRSLLLAPECEPYRLTRPRHLRPLPARRQCRASAATSTTF